MKRILVIAPSGRFDEESSFRIRLLALQESMRRRGFQWDVVVRPKSPWKRLKLAWSAGDYDAVVLHRKMLDAYEARALRRSLSPPRKIILDIDDATMYHERRLGAYARRRLERRFEVTAAAVDVVCAGNAYLGTIFEKQAESAGRRPPAIRVIPSAVAPERYAVKTHASTDKPRLVWIGSASTLKYLESAYEALGAAAPRVPGLTLAVICDRPSEKPAPVPVEFVKWSLAGEAAALEQGDIGLAPTPEDRWTLGKCGYKIVQYMATGLPVIASPVGVNSDLVLGGGSPCGILARDPAEWAAAIERLANDVDLRRTLGNAGRRRVEKEICVETVACAWEQILRGG